MFKMDSIRILVSVAVNQGWHLRRWLKESDRNTKIFHKTANARKEANLIHDLKVDEKWVDDNVEIRKEIENYFTYLYSESHVFRPSLEGFNFCCIFDREGDFLE